jgi:hypothetical protein
MAREAKGLFCGQAQAPANTKSDKGWIVYLYLLLGKCACKIE